MFDFKNTSMRVLCNGKNTIIQLIYSVYGTN